jgi:three-Cys-motif partner protein
MPLRHSYLIAVEDDGLPAAEVGPWAAEKYRRFGMYADMFATGMKHKWDQRIYLDLFSGPGHAWLRDANGVRRQQQVLTSPLLALTSPDPFDHYIFCDYNRAAIDALKIRAARLAPNVSATFLQGDVNSIVPLIEHHIPRHRPGHTVLSLCVVDPFDLSIRFDTIRGLGQHRAMDFVILLATDMDGRRNWATYLQASSDKVELFLGDTDWRGRWARASALGDSPARFLAEQYAQRMVAIGYLPTTIERMISIRTHSNNMQLYYLAFFSKHRRGHDFWDDVRRYSTDQLRFF